MSMSKNLGAYADIAGVLSAALTADGATLRLETYGKARHWIQRAYFWRRLLHEKQINCPYDNMKLSAKGNEVTIEFNTIGGVLMDKKGKVIKATPYKLEERLSDEDFEMVEEVKRDLGLEVGGEEG